jgi:hypothetical protein
VFQLIQYTTELAATQTTTPEYPKHLPRHNDFYSIYEVVEENGGTVPLILILGPRLIWCLVSRPNIFTQPSTCTK